MSITEYTDITTKGEEASKLQLPHEHACNNLSLFTAKDNIIFSLIFRLTPAGT